MANSLDALARFVSVARAGPVPAAGGSAPGPGLVVLPPSIAEGHLAVVEQARKLGAMDLAPSRPGTELPGVSWGDAGGLGRHTGRGVHAHM